MTDTRRDTPVTSPRGGAAAPTVAHVSASGLALLAIVVLTAAYLVPGRIRARRRVASARTADRESEALRVVVRRAGSAVTVPAPALAGASSRPVLTGPARPALPAAAVPATGPAAAPATVPAPRPAGASPARPAAPRGREVVRRRRRLVAVLASATAAAWLAAVLVPLAGPALPWWPALAPTAVLGLVLAALARHGAPAPRPLARPVPVAAPAPAPAAAPVVRAPATARPVPAPRTAEPAAAPAAPAASSAPAAPAVPSAPAADARPGAGYDVELEDADVVAAARAGGWTPAPVPLPTYLLKPKARTWTTPVPRTVDLTAVDRELDADLLDDDLPRVLDLRDLPRAAAR